MSKLYICSIVALLFISACYEDKSVRVYSVEKEASGGELSAHGYGWSIPDWWVSRNLQSNFQIASYLVPIDADYKTDDMLLFATASISIIDGDAGGIVANVNRWRRQINLDAVIETKISAIRQEIVGEFAGMGKYYMKYERQAIIGVIFEHEGKTIFIKLHGNKGTVNANRHNFDKMIKSFNVK